jgi:hypothetical protein
MKIWKIIVLIAVVVLAGLGLAREHLTRHIMLSLLHNGIGGDIAVTAFESDLAASRLTLRGVHLRNPRVWPSGLDIYLNELSCDYEWATLFRRPPHLTALTVDIARVEMRLDEQSLVHMQNNLVRQALRTPRRSRVAANEDAHLADSPSARREWSGQDATGGMRIDHLILRLGEFTVHNALLPDQEPVPMTYRLNLEQEFENVTDFDEVIRTIGDSLQFVVGW